MSKKKELNKLISGLKKRFGDDVILSGTEAKEKLSTKRIPTASMELNIALYGGFVRGTVVEIFGPESSGKTEILLETIGEQQEQDEDFLAVWLETESSLDIEDAIKKHGVDPDRIEVIPLDPSKGAEEALEIIRGFIASGLIDMIVINSIAGLVTKGEADKEVGDAVMAEQARMMSKFFRMEISNIGKNETLVAFVNQERDNIGSYGGGAVTGGGKATKYYATQRVRLAKQKIGKAEGDIEKVIKIHAKVVKNRKANGKFPFKECDYYAEYGKGVNKAAEIVTIAKREDLGFEISGSWWYYPCKDKPNVDENGIEMKWNSAAKVRAYLEDNQKFLKQLIDKVLTLDNLTAKSIKKDEVEKIEEEEEKLVEEMNKLVEEK